MTNDEIDDYGDCVVNRRWRLDIRCDFARPSNPLEISLIQSARNIRVCRSDRQLPRANHLIGHVKATPPVIPRL